MSNRDSLRHNEHLAFVDRDAARIQADLRALGVAEYAEQPMGLLGRLLRRTRTRSR